jgi:hypothetical protein
MSTVLIIIIIAVAAPVLLIIPAIIGLEQLARQKRIMKMKRFRASVRPQQAELSADDKRTVI